MSDRRYSLGLCVNASPEQAFLASLAKPMPTPGMIQHVGPQERAFLALFSVLTESQQERALHRLGWEREPAPPVPPRLPEPEPAHDERAALVRELDEHASAYEVPAGLVQRAADALRKP